MAESDAPTCSSCGARLDAEADVCDLCGTPVASSDSSSNDPEPSRSSEADAVYCNQCGWENPLDANYCSKCGSRLQDVTAKPAEAPSGKPVSEISAEEVARREGEEEEPKSRQNERTGLQKQVGVLIGASVLLVVALFVLLVYGGGGSEQAAPQQNAPQPSTQSAPAPQMTAPPDTQQGTSLAEGASLSGALADRADSLKQVLADAPPSERARTKRELVELYVGAGRRDLAALEQEELAQQVGTTAAWTRAGHMLYEWMLSEKGPEKAQIAQRAISAYQRVLEEEPDNLDVRTNMGWAYLQTRSNPMQGIEEIKQVLDKDPDHVAARFNYGIALARIGRTKKALQQFDHIKQISEPDSPEYRQAEQVIQRIQQQSAGSS